MGDIRLVWHPATATGDFNLAGSALEVGHDLETAVLISLFSDAQADPGDIVPDNADPRGWWADTYAAEPDQALIPIDNDRTGSKLWQIFARPRTQETLNWARSETLAALNWMLIDGVASAIDVQTVFAGSAGIGISVTITANGTPTVFSYAWAQEI